MKKSVSICLLFLSVQFSFAQKKFMTLQESMLNARTTLAPSNLKSLQFVKGTGDYVYLKKVGGMDKWIRGSFDAPKESEYLSMTELNRRLREASLDTLATMPPVQFEKDKYFVSIKGRKFSFDNTGSGYREVIDKETAAGTNMEESAAGYFAYLSKSNLFIKANGKVRQVTTDGSDDIVYASSVHRDEFGITKGTFWSPGGKSLAFYRMDQSMVKNYPIINWAGTPAKVENIKYPMAGDTSHRVTLHVYDIETETLIKIKTPGPDDHYLTNIAWSPDNRFVFIAELNRGQDLMQLNQYDARTGDFVKMIYKEGIDYGYVEPLVPILFLKNNPDMFVLQSRKDGWNHLYLHDMKKNAVKQLTSGAWEVVEVKGFDEVGENLYYVSTEISPVSRNLYCLNLRSGKRKAITSGDFMHNTQVSSDGAFVLDNFSSTSNPRTIRIIQTKTGKAKDLLQAEDPLAEYATSDPEIFTIAGKSGDPLYCRVYRPVAFDSTKKYPVIVYWYGGPHNQLILNAWNGGAGDYWFRYMASQGFLVFSMDVRGSSYRGRNFEMSIYRNAGAKQMEDLMSGMQYLSGKNYVDSSRMGLFGWSFGGFLTTNFMLTNPGKFRAAVAGGPVMDWSLYEVMYTERYMDTPAENPEGYKATNLIARAGDLKGKLLLIHGLQDPVVVQQHSVNFVKAAVDKGVQVDYMIYPGHEHNVGGKDRVHLYQKVTDYFLEYLK